MGKRRILPDGTRIVLNVPEPKRSWTVTTGRGRKRITRKVLQSSRGEVAHRMRNAARHLEAVERQRARRAVEKASAPQSAKEAFRAKLVKYPTKAERALCNLLVEQAVPFDFQPIICGYIPDFGFPDRKLLIELDGGVHSDPEQHAYDVQRDKNLTKAGWTVVRFPNSTVTDSPEAILTTIDGAR